MGAESDDVFLLFESVFQRPDFFFHLRDAFEHAFDSARDRVGKGFEPFVAFLFGGDAGNTTRPGTPMTVEYSGTSCRTTEPEPILVFSPIFTGPRT